VVGRQVEDVPSTVWLAFITFDSPDPDARIRRFLFEKSWPIIVPYLHVTQPVLVLGMLARDLLPLGSLALPRDTSGMFISLV
jgi:hypothetical protein